MDLTIIIVNWNSAEYVRKCLGSLFANTKGTEFEVIVIDNASYDDCEKVVVGQFPQVRFFQSERNLGFAGANNWGAEEAKGEWLLFLNPDTEINGDAVEGMLEVGRTLPDAGAVGCKLLNTDGTTQTSCVQRFPTILNQVLTWDVLYRLLPAISKLDFAKKGPLNVEVVSGACLMMRKSSFVAIGGFSSEYFMYTEDIDLCYKAHQAGYRNYYTGASSVLHHGGGSSHHCRENSYADVQMGESVFKFLRKTRGAFYANLYKKAMFLNGIARFVLLWASASVLRLCGRKASFQTSITKWRDVIRWSLGMEKWAR